MSSAPASGERSREQLISNPRDPGRDPEHPLARAFASFTEAAGSLERSYGQLQGQVTQLRQELEVTNRNLATSLEENRRIRERLRRILEGLPCGVLVMEDDTRITTLNPEGARLIGGNFESADAMPEALFATLGKARQTDGEAEAPLGSMQNAKPGQAEWVAVRHAWLEQKPPNSTSTSIFILRDVSDAKKMEQEREQLRRQQALVEVSALLAHEIRNPLGSLELFAGLLAEAELDGESRGWIEHVQAGLRTLAATVNNVLHLHNTPQTELAETDAGELLDWAYGFLLPLARQAGVEMQVINGLQGVRVHADRHRLEQVLLNLALNAFRFMPGGGWLCIHGLRSTLNADPAVASAAKVNELASEVDNEAGSEVGGEVGTEAGNEVEIIVRDTGPGIASGDLPRIFEAGFSTRAGSSGLGLAVCKRILEQHRGTLSVESRYGFGAAFHLRLPCRPAIVETGERR